jgi:hypothetical protein
LNLRRRAWQRRGEPRTWHSCTEPRPK